MDLGKYPSSAPEDVKLSIELGIEPVDRSNVSTSDYLTWQIKMMRAQFDKLRETVERRLP